MVGPSTDIGSSVSLDAKGNLYTAGSFEETVDFDAGPLSYLLKSNGARDIFITKMDSKGELIWAKNIGGDKSDDGRYMSTDLSGNIYITGTFQGTVDFDPGPGLFPLTSQNKDDLFILKLNADGNFLWAYQFNASTYIDINALVLDAQNNVYLTGYFNERIDFDFGSSGIFNWSIACGNRLSLCDRSRFSLCDVIGASQCWFNDDGSNILEANETE